MPLSPAAAACQAAPVKEISSWSEPDDNKTSNSLPLFKKNLAPRIGFAYAVDSKTVVRGGYGIFYIPNFVSFNTNPYIDPVNSGTSPFFASNNGGAIPCRAL